MNIDTANEFLPVRASYYPTFNQGQEKPNAYLRQDQPQRGLKFIGYGFEDEPSLYRSSGEKTEKPGMSGKVIDIYV